MRPLHPYTPPPSAYTRAVRLAASVRAPAGPQCEVRVRASDDESEDAAEDPDDCAEEDPHDATDTTSAKIAIRCATRARIWPLSMPDKQVTFLAL